jgi:hypothetical protein
MDATSSLFSWADVLKLSVPAATALAAIWVRAVHEHRKERKLLQETLLRGFDRGPLCGAACITLLHDVVMDVKAGRSTTFHLVVPKVISQTCERLAAIDPSRAHLYTDHLGILSHIDFAVAEMQRLLAAYLTSSTEPSPRLKNGIASAAHLAMEPFVQLERSQLAIAESLALSGLVKPTDQAVTRICTALSEAEAALQAKDLTKALGSGTG